MSMNPRPYQWDHVQKTIELFDLHGVQTGLGVAPTGTGKTVTFGFLARHYLQNGRIMVVAHRDELIGQAAETLQTITSAPVEIEKAERYANTGSLFPAKIIVGSVQTLNSGQRLSRFDANEFSLLIIDEAHHAPSKTYRRVIDHFKANPKCRVLGVTATPDRHDEKAMGRVFDDVAFHYELQDAIHDGWLVPVVQRFVLVDSLDFSKVRTTAGDLNGADLAKVMEYEENLHKVVSPTMQIAGDRRTIVFASSVDHAERMCEIINRHKPNAATFVCGNTEDDLRKSRVAAFKRGDVQFFCNVGIATEGFDAPDVELVVIARPTKSRALYSQMVGRGTRPLPGIVDIEPDSNARRIAIANSSKSECEVLDFVGNSGKHKLVCTGDILGGNYDDEVVEWAKREAAKAECPVDMEEELRKAEIELAKEKQRKEEARRASLRAKARYRIESINPFDALNILPGRTPGYMKYRPPTDKQRALLEKWGVALSEIDKMDTRQASRLIGGMIERSRSGRATYKQIRFLRKLGVKDANNLSAREASVIIKERTGR